VVSVSRDLETLPLLAYIRGTADGLFDILPHHEPDCAYAEIVVVRDLDLEPYDAVAWEVGKPGKWWTLRGAAAVLGEGELSMAWWEARPARLLATPADFIAAHGAGFVLLDWAAPINDIIGACPAVQCADHALANRLKRTLWQQAMPSLPITIVRREVSRAA
jgi:hypothetical protein